MLSLKLFAVLLDRYAGSLFNDYLKFFDTVDIPTLIDRAEKVNFPLAELAIGYYIGPASSTAYDPARFCM